MGKNDSFLKKRNIYQKLSFELLDYSRKIRDYQTMIEELKLATDKNEQKMDEMESDLTILTCIYQFHNGEELYYIYYDADLERTRTYNTDVKTVESLGHDPLNADIDLHEFFDSYATAEDRHLLTARHNSTRIMEIIIEDMLSKKEYKNWSEVKEDLSNLEETYRRPFASEWSADYYINVICKSKKKSKKKK